MPTQQAEKLSDQLEAAIAEQAKAFIASRRSGVGGQPIFVDAVVLGDCLRRAMMTALGEVKP